MIFKQNKISKITKMRIKYISKNLWKKFEEK